MRHFTFKIRTFSVRGTAHSLGTTHLRPISSPLLDNNTSGSATGNEALASGSGFAPGPGLL